MPNINWRVDNNQAAALTILAMANAAAFWNANCPSIYEVPGMASDADAKANIKLGVAKSLVEAGMLGVGATLITESWWPLVGVIGYIGISSLFTRYALAGAPGLADE